MQSSHRSKTFKTFAIFLFLAVFYCILFNFKERKSCKMNPRHRSAKISTYDRNYLLQFSEYRNIRLNHKDYLNLCEVNSYCYRKKTGIVEENSIESDLEF